MHSCGLTEMFSFQEIKRPFLIRFGAYPNIDAIQKNLSQLDNEIADEYFNQVITKRITGWKDEPVEERYRQATIRLIYTNKHKAIFYHLERKRRDFELIGKSLDQATFRERMFRYSSQQDISVLEQKGIDSV